MIWDISVQALRSSILNPGEEGMKFQMQTFAPSLMTVIVGVALIVPSAFAANGKTFTGTVSDSMCGAKHVMAGDDAGCARACVSKGSTYALVVGDKVYTLDTTDKDALATLDKMAGTKVTVIGTEKDNTITVKSVTAARQ
jgi:hypothetical protein